MDVNYFRILFNLVQKVRDNTSRLLLCHKATLAAREPGKSSRGRQRRRKLERSLGKSDTDSYCLINFFVLNEKELTSIKII